MIYDVEAVFHFEKDRKLYEGYRPAHLIKENYLTTGVHHYFNTDETNNAKGMIAFLSPEYYPHCLWCGKNIDMYEGSRYIGYAEITKIINPLLEGGKP